MMLFAHSLLPLVYLVGLEMTGSYSVVRGRVHGAGWLRVRGDCESEG